MTAEPWPNERSVDAIAFVLLDRSDEERRAIIVDAFNHAIAKHPHVAEPELDPRIIAFVAAIYQAIARMERERGNA